jgi:glycosyltransferase involved in cell wall biosynthesis
MRALILCNKFPYPSTDGSSIAIMRMIDTLLAANIEVSLFSLNTKKHYKDTTALTKAYADKLNITSVDVLTDITASNTLANLLSGQPFHVSRFYVSDVSDKLKNLLEKEQFDIVQFEGVFMGPYLELVRKHSNSKCVLRPHNIEYKIWERFIKSEKNNLKSLYLQLQTRRLKKYELEIIPQFDGIVPISDADKKYIESFAKKPILTIPCATDLNKYKEAPSEKANFFHIGAMDWMPNVSGMEWFLDEVWPLVLSKLPQATFNLAGRDMPDSLMTHSQSGVSVIGEVESAETFYKQNGILVVPLLSGSGIRIKIIEGLSYGKAIVSTTIGAMGINLKTNENIIISDSPEDFANSMVKLYEDKAFRLKLGENARTTAQQKFDVNALGTQISEFYNRLF